MLVVTEQLSIPLSELTFTYARSSGPGGQNVNKVNSKATLDWAPGLSPHLPADILARLRAKFATRFTKDGRLQISSERYRDQGRNVADCLDKLRRMLLQVAEPPKKRRKTRPSRASKERRLETKRQQAEKKSQRQRRYD